MPKNEIKTFLVDRTHKTPLFYILIGQTESGQARLEPIVNIGGRFHRGAANGHILIRYLADMSQATPEEVDKLLEIYK